LKKLNLHIRNIKRIHFYLRYQPGSLAACNQPLCCRNSSNYNNSIGDERSAGFWGDYRNCDLPIWTVENMFDYISKNEKASRQF
jgi:sphingomyelin phosphodiesterase